MKDIHTFIQMFQHLYEILTSKQQKKLLIVFLFTILSAMFEMLGISAIMPFIQALTYPKQLIEKKYVLFFANLFGVATEMQIVVMAGIGTILVYIIKNIFLLISSYIRLKFSTTLTKDLSILVMDSYMHRPYEYFTLTNSSEILQGINGDAYSIDQIVTNMMQFFMESMIIVTIGTYLLIVDPVMALGILAFASACAFIIVVMIKKRISHLGIVNRQTLMELNQVSIHISNGIKDIYVSQKKEKFLNKFRKKEEAFSKTRLQYLVIGAMPERLIETVCITGIISVVLIRFISVTDVAAFIASLAVFAVAAFRILPSISRISGYLSTLIFLRPALDAAYKSITVARAYTKDSVIHTEARDKDTVTNFQEEIKAEHVVWRYQHREKNILSDTNLTIKKGEAVGIIGESGAGKSTLSDILLGLYVPQSGSVTVDGHIITDIPRSWSKMIGYVPQTVFLMDDTVRANVAFGEDDANDTQVWNALEQASLKEFIESLPNGLDTIVGERGIKFSGGQRQRIAIARALYNKPDILILDEATSALDTETETAVMQAIESLQGTITLIIIAHRLSTIRNCDKIYEIVDGQAKLKRHEEIFQ